MLKVNCPLVSFKLLHTNVDTACRVRPAMIISLLINNIPQLQELAGIIAVLCSEVAEPLTSGH